MTHPKNRLSVIIANWEANKKVKFSPTREFYKLMKIGQKRFQLLLKNKTDITVGEAYRLSTYFEVEFADMLVLTTVEKQVQVAEETEEKAQNVNAVPKKKAMEMLNIKSQATINKLIQEGKLKQVHLTPRNPFITLESIRAITEQEKPKDDFAIKKRKSN